MWLIRLFVSVLVLSMVAGCATRGPNHVYLTLNSDTGVHDLGPQGNEITHAVGADEHVLGLAYDYNTDHLFMRIAPAQVIRVIERPSGRVLREMPLPADLQTSKPADLAIRSSDRHLFAVHSDGRSVVELTLFGEFIRRIELPALGGLIGGLAFDQRQSRLLVLVGDLVFACSAEGRELGRTKLHAPINAVSLGYDSDGQQYFVPLSDGQALGVFDAKGDPIAFHPSDGQERITAVDAGPRSFVRVF